MGKDQQSWLLLLLLPFQKYLEHSHRKGKREFEWHFKRFKEGIEETKLFLEHD